MLWPVITYSANHDPDPSHSAKEAYQKSDRPTSEPEVKDEEPSWPFGFHFLVLSSEASLCDLGTLPLDLGPLLSIGGARKDGGVDVNLGGGPQCHWQMPKVSKACRLLQSG